MIRVETGDWNKDPRVEERQGKEWGGGGREAGSRPPIQEGSLTYSTNNKDHNTPPWLRSSCRLPIRLPHISLDRVLRSLPLLACLKISAGGPLIASLISHVRRLRGFTGDVELLQIITRLPPPFTCSPSIPPFSLLTMCLSSTPSFSATAPPHLYSRSCSHDLMINYGCEFENKSSFANQNEISPSIPVITVWRWCCRCLIVAKAGPPRWSEVCQGGWNEYWRHNGFRIIIKKIIIKEEEAT